MSRAPKQPATPKPAPPVLERMGTATLGPVFTLQLDQIVLAPEVYRHRAQKDLEPKKVTLKELADNLIVEGQRDPLIVYKDENPTDPARPYVLVAGHRRHAAMLLLCDKNTPNFTKDMSVTAREIGGGSKADYLLLSVSDNLFHEPLDSHHLILAAVSLLKAGVSHTRIKVNLRLSDSTFARCVRLYESPWMLEHVVQGNLGLTDVHLLLEAAGGKGGRVALEHLRQDLDRVFAEIRKIIRAKEEALAEQGKELKGAATKVKTYLPRHLIKSWILALKRGERLRQQAKYRYGAGIIQEKLGKRVYLPALSIPLTDEEIDRLTEVAVRLDQLLKQLRPQLVLLAQARANAVINGDGDGADGLGELEAAGLSEVAKILGSMKRHLRHPDDDTDPDREAAQREANQNWQDQEEKERKLDDPTAGVGVGPTQPAANQEIEAEVQRLIDELNEQPEADPDE